MGKSKMSCKTRKYFRNLPSSLLISVIRHFSRSQLFWKFGPVSKHVLLNVLTIYHNYDKHVKIKYSSNSISRKEMLRLFFKYKDIAKAISYLGLSIQDDIIEDSVHLKQFVLRCTSIKTLHVETQDEFYWERWMENISDHLELLENLSVSTKAHVDEVTFISAITRLGKSCRHLVSLELALHFSWLQSNVYVNSVLDECSHLETVKLISNSSNIKNWGRHISNKELNILFSNCKSLKQVVVQNYKYLVRNYLLRNQIFKSVE